MKKKLLTEMTKKWRSVFQLAILVVFLICLPIEVNATPIDLASAFGTASASESWIFHTPELAIDDDPISFWNAGRIGSTSDPPWLVVDLNNIYEVQDIVLANPDHDNALLGNSWAYNLYVSTDAYVWHSIASGWLYDSDDPASYSDIISVPDAFSVLQYAKFEVVGGTHWAGLHEMEILGEASPVPEPTITLLFGIGIAVLAGTRLRRKK